MLKNEMSTLKKNEIQYPSKDLEKENQQLGKKLEESKRKRKKQRKESIEHQELFGKGIEKNDTYTWWNENYFKKNGRGD